MNAKQLAAFLTAIIVCSTAFGQYPVYRQTADAKSPSVRDFADSVLPKLQNQTDTMFESLSYSKNKNELLRDGEAVPGNSFSGFRVIDGELRVAASETVRAGETAKQEFLSLEEAAPLIGLETYETEDGIRVSDPFRSGTLIVKSDDLSDTKGASELGSGWNDLHVLQYPTAADAYAAYQEFQKDDRVTFAEPNRIYHIDAPKETLSSDYEFPSDNWGWRAIGADGFLEKYGESAASAPDVVAAVIDTGLYADHKWFQNRIAENGTSFIPENGGSFDDLHGHGTHCAGIICGMTPDNVKILPLRVLNADGYGDGLSIYCAMLYAAEQDVDVVSMSLGGDGTSAMFDEAVKILKDHDIPCVVAAGNESNDAKYHHPANVPDAITVSSVSRACDDYMFDEPTDCEFGYTLSYFSNFGQGIDFAAPGDNINSAYNLSPEFTTRMSGTSMACPHVAGCVADILTVQNDYTVDEVYACLKANAVDYDEVGFDEHFGWGMVNIANLDFTQSALAQPLASQTSVTVVEPFDVTLSTPEEGAEIRYTLDGTDPDSENGILYQGEEISIRKTTTLSAVTVKDGEKSAVARWNYIFYKDPPEVYPRSDSFHYDVTAEVENAEDYTVIYTLDGSDPTLENGILYTGSIEITETAILKVAFVIGEYVSDPTVCYYRINDVDLEPEFEAENGVLTKYTGFCAALDLNDYFEPGEITAIGKDVFKNSEMLKSIILPDSVVSIGENAFLECRNLETVSAPGVEAIGAHGFDCCNSIVNFDMPALKKVGEYGLCNTFYINGTDNPIPEDNQIEELADYAFEGTNLTKAAFPNLKKMGKGVFGYCYDLQSIVLPENITVLPANTFYLCSELVSLDAPGITEIGDLALYTAEYDTPSLTECSIDFSKVTSVGTESLKLFAAPMDSVSFDALTHVEPNAFADFKVKELILPALKEVPAYVFWDAECTAVYLEHAEKLEVGALTPNPDWENEMVYVFGDDVVKNQANPLESGCDTVTIAAPAGSPMKRFAEMSRTAYCETPDIYVPSGFDSIRQYTNVDLDDCKPLAFGCKITWTVTETAYADGYEAPEQPVYTDSTGKKTFLDTSVPGTVTLQADVTDDSDTVLKSKTLTVSIAPAAQEEIMTGEGVFIVNWNKALTHKTEPDSIWSPVGVDSRYEFTFKPEEDGKFSFIPETEDITVSVFNSKNELVSRTNQWSYPGEMSFAPAQYKSDETYRVLVETHSDSVLNNVYGGILITKGTPTQSLDDTCSVTMEQTMFEKGSALPEDPDVSVEVSYWDFDWDNWDGDPDAYEAARPEVVKGVDYCAVFLRNGNSGFVDVYGMGNYFGTVRIPICVYEEYTLGEKIEMPEIQPGETLCYHISEVPSDMQYVIGTGFSDAFLQQIASGEYQEDPFACGAYLELYDSDHYYVSNDESSYYLFSEECYTLEAGKEYYLEVHYVPFTSTLAEPHAPEGMLTLYSNIYQDNHWIYKCDLENIPAKRFSGHEMNFIHKVTDPDGNVLEEGKDYAVYVNKTAMPGEHDMILVGIGDYYGGVSMYATITEPYVYTGPFAPVKISLNEPFSVSSTCGFFELNTDGRSVCTLRGTDSSAADPSFRYSFNVYDSAHFEWVPMYSGNTTDGEVTLELEPGSYHVFIEQSTENKEYILETQESVTGIGNAEVHTDILYYTGDVLTPEITLTYDGNTLTEDEDYIIAYPNEPIQECGVYELMISGIGSFCSACTVRVIVAEQEQSDMLTAVNGDNTVSTEAGKTSACAWIPDAAKYGVQMNELHVASLIICDSETGREVANLNGHGFLSEIFEVTPGKTYYIYTSWYRPEYAADIRFTLVPDCIDLSTCTIDGPSQILFTEPGVLPEFTVKDGDTALSEGTDYTIYYSGGNNRAGHAMISMTGTGHCIGELQYHYFICPKPAEFDADGQITELYLNKDKELVAHMPGDYEQIEFTAPADGQYRFSRPDPMYSGVTVFAYGPDNEVLPFDAESIALNEGEKLRFIAVSDHLEDYMCEFNDYRLGVYAEGPIYEIEVGDNVYLIRDGAAYFERYNGNLVGIQVPETICDPGTGAEMTVKGLTANLLSAIGTKVTFYCAPDTDLFRELASQNVCVAATDPQTGIRGDVTGDGIIDANDWMTLIRCINEAPGMIMNESVFAAADFNEDGCIDMQDANIIRDIAITVPG